MSAPAVRPGDPSLPRNWPSGVTSTVPGVAVRRPRESSSSNSPSLPGATSKSGAMSHCVQHRDTFGGWHWCRAGKNEICRARIKWCRKRGIDGAHRPAKSACQIRRQPGIPRSVATRRQARVRAVVAHGRKQNHDADQHAPSTASVSSVPRRARRCAAAASRGVDSGITASGAIRRRERQAASCVCSNGAASCSSFA